MEAAEVGAAEVEVAEASDGSQRRRPAAERIGASMDRMAEARCNNCCVGWWDGL